MSLHSKFLVHWTGKDIEEEHPKALWVGKYVERLKNDYQSGLFTRRSKEGLLAGSKIKHLVRICFTEIRLSQSQTHASRYGNLGIGFSRDFIISKGGRPVIYIPHRAANSPIEDALTDIRKGSSNVSVLGFIKRMSGDKGEDWYEEMEWRLVRSGSSGNVVFVKEKQNSYRVRFAPTDVMIIIMPDPETKQRALDDNTLKPFFQEHMPMIVTLEDCRSF